jgi:aspartate racemase
MLNQRLTVGVLGGMGPQATVDLLQRIVRGTPADDDADHIRILVDNNPSVPSRIDYLLNQRGENPAPVLVKMAQGLSAQGADFLIMPCNTAHLYAAEISSAVPIPFINMIDTTVRSITGSNASTQRVGILASTAVIKTGLFENAFQAKGIPVISPEDADQEMIMALIKRMKAGKQNNSDRQCLTNVASSLLQQQADCLVIACTELSALDAEMPLQVPVIDTSQCLAEETIKLALGRKPL